MFCEQRGVFTLATLAISGTAVLICWWYRELKKRRTKNEASMALTAHEDHQCEKSQLKEKDDESLNRRYYAEMVTGALFLHGQTDSDKKANDGMASEDVHSKAGARGYRSVHFKSVKSVSEIQEVITHPRNTWGKPERKIVSWSQEETTSWSRVYCQRTSA